MIVALAIALAVAAVFFGVVVLQLLRLLSAREQAAQRERQELLQMRVVNTNLQFATEEPPQGTPQEGDEFERVGSIYADDE